MAAAAVVAAAGGHFTPRAPAERPAPRMRRHARAPPALPPGGRYGSVQLRHSVRGGSGPCRAVLGCAGHYWDMQDSTRMYWDVLGGTGPC